METDRDTKRKKRAQRDREGETKDRDTCVERGRDTMRETDEDRKGRERPRQRKKGNKK